MTNVSAHQQMKARCASAFVYVSADAEAAAACPPQVNAVQCRCHALFQFITRSLERSTSTHTYELKVHGTRASFANEERMFATDAPAQLPVSPSGGLGLYNASQLKTGGPSPQREPHTENP